MRLSTAPDRDRARAIRVIHAALDAGATLLDTADAYGHGESDTGHNELLVGGALRTWPGDRSRITVATKGGMRRPKGAWVPDGRAKHLREACEASRRQLGVDRIDLYQLHVVDPKTPLETSVRALAALQRDGVIAQIGLCNVTVNQIERARAIAPIASVQVSLSPLDDENLRNGVAEYCRSTGIRLIAHRPLGGDKIDRLRRDEVVQTIADANAATPEAVVLAWLMSFGADVTPIPGATRVESAEALADALALELTDDERRQLDARFRGRLLRVPRAERRPVAGAATGDVVLVMGMPGSGKSTLAGGFENAGYARLNRDALGGSLADLVPRLDAALESGQRHVVLDNTYATRASRNEVIECAWSRGVPVRCVWVDTALGDAQINAIERMLDAEGHLPSPEVIRERGRKDPRYLLPDAQFRFERALEPPTHDEGFESVERRPFQRVPSEGGSALIVDFDDIWIGDAPADGATEVLAAHRAEGRKIFAHAWRPGTSRGETSADELAAAIERARSRLGTLSVGTCAHDAGPPICWCRKPLPGLVLEFARRDGVAPDQCIVVGRSTADRVMAERLGARFIVADKFFNVSAV